MKPVPNPARSPDRFLATLERLVAITTTDLRATLSEASDLVAEATGADKVDNFLYDARRESLVAIGSNQPLSALQRKMGLDVLQLANGGRVVHVFRTGQTFMSGRLDEDPEELKGIKEALAIRSKLGVPLEVAGARRGVLMIASLKRDYFTAEDARFAESVARWIATVAHRAELAEQIAQNAMKQGRRAAAEEIVTVLAHDLRNILSPLQLRLFSLRQRNRSAEDLADLDVAERASGRLRELITEILDVARIDQGVFRVDLQRVDVVSLLEEVAGLLSTPDSPVRVKVQASIPLVVEADASRLRQCLENLVANAVQQSPKGAEVAVIAANEKREDGEWTRIDVLDQGPGIPADVLPHVFERFASGTEGGLGLGLYVARRIVELHGGELLAESKPGEGARFVLSLPCCPDAAAPPGSRPKPALLRRSDLASSSSP